MTKQVRAFLLMTAGLGPLAVQGLTGFSFIEVAEDVGITMMNLSGAETNDYIIEANGNGAAFFDYDRDGDLDLLITNGSTLEAYARGGDPLAALYENRGGRFADVTVQAGLEETGWGSGVCVADYDNDGHSDVYLTAYGPNVLYRNNGDGTFGETGAGAGVADPRWSTNCTFGDYDRDGDVDLYVANYLTFDTDVIPRRGESPDGRYMGTLDVFHGPRNLPGEPDVLYRNNGDGTFTDVTEAAGIADPGYFGFGVSFSDFDNDGWPDIYVANDSVPNFLFKNNQDGTFTEIGLISGTSVSLAGYDQAGMGLAVGDYDRNGLFDIFVTNFAQDTNTLYQNTGNWLFSDVSLSSGASAASRFNLGWGAGLVDLDNDGWLDIFVANGHVYPGVDALEVRSQYLEPKEVYRNLGDGNFEEITSRVGGDLVTARPARGAAFGDYDSDGDIDIVVINISDRPDLYRNDGGNGSHWIGFDLEGVFSNRDAIGARVEIETGGRTQVSEVRSGGSYLSHNDMRIHFGLGDARRVDRIRVRWPDGDVEVLEGVRADQYVTIREGSGIVTD